MAATVARLPVRARPLLSGAASEPDRLPLLRDWNAKKFAIVLHDLVMTALAVAISLVLRFDDAALAERVAPVARILPFFVLYAGAVYAIFGLYRAKWRFASLPDLANIAKSVGVLTATALLIDYVLVGGDFYGSYFLGRQVIFIYALAQMALLGGPRLAYRYWKDSRRRSDSKASPAAFAILIGRASDAEFAIRAVESGTLKGLLPKAILSPRPGEAGMTLRGVPILGTVDSLEAVVAEFEARGTAFRRILVLPSVLSEEQPEQLFRRARKLGLALSRLQSLDEEATQIAPVEIEDLLLRPTVSIDSKGIGRFLRGKRVVVTGGGGSIGSEVCMKVAAAGAASVLILENSEPALHAISERLLAQGRKTEILGHICDVRDRQRLSELLGAFKPDVVFHAAALKHVPYLETDWEEGIRTNIRGSMNAADASVAAGADVFVMISTDKAIQPVSMLGATKRFAEIYTEALDDRMRGEGGRTRLISVRFGNVLGSNGSVVPKFKAQIERGGPVTVTHPDMVRYFMTVGEAADLVLTAATHARDEGAAARASTYVLQMGQPVRIMDLAERMIRLSGFEPGVEMEIAFTGVRPGERLHEILFATDEKPVDIGVQGVLAAQTRGATLPVIADWVKRLDGAVLKHDRDQAEAVLTEAIPTFAQRNGVAPPVPPGLEAPVSVAASRAG